MMNPRKAKEVAKRGFDLKFWDEITNGDQTVSGSDGKKIRAALAELKWLGIDPTGKFKSPPANDLKAWTERLGKAVTEAEKGIGKIKAADKNWKSAVAIYKDKLRVIRSTHVANVVLPMAPAVVAQIPKKGIDPKFWMLLTKDNQACDARGVSQMRESLGALKKLGVKPDGTFKKAAPKNPEEALAIGDWLCELARSLRMVEIEVGRISKVAKPNVAAATHYKRLVSSLRGAHEKLDKTTEAYQAMPESQRQAGGRRQRAS